MSKTQADNMKLIIIVCIFGLTKARDNMILQLLQSFGRMHNTSSLTACLPLPHSASHPLEWGVLTFNLSRMWNNIHNISGMQIIKVPRDQTVYYSNGTQCWSRGLSILPTGEQIIWDILENKSSSCPDGFQRDGLPNGEDLCWNVDDLYSSLYGRKKRSINSESGGNWTSYECAQVPWGMDLTSIWKSSEQGEWHYSQKADWCLEWAGEVGANLSSIKQPLLEEARKKLGNSMLNCTNIFNCTSSDLEIQQIGPIARTLRLGCLCRNLTTSINQTWRGDNSINCKKKVLPAMGHTVWVKGDGTWTTHLPLDGKTQPFTLGLLTLCPLWRKNPITPVSNGLVKRDQTKEEDWKKPSAGTVVGWVLESIFSPQSMSLHNKFAIDNLTGQVEVLANATQNSLWELNQQAQSTSKMTLQNRQALDLLLARDHGLCGYIQEDPENCCIHIPNVMGPLKEQLERIKKVAATSRNIKENLETDWVKTMFGKLGISLSGWWSNLILILIIVIIALMIGGCVKTAVLHTIWK
ncbi:uncharacterized protein [Apteryx mantelli]|uniref:Uncharacterized protein isoform X1 n=1 Tax=Apteryx mantelli TaxID=2696672 RepID=A0ABM4F0W6_9AVES|nr:PREDICTED: uncharacterized protein LOC106483239 [Apteryx mantelli mantelli]